MNSEMVQDHMVNAVELGTLIVLLMIVFVFIIFIYIYRY